MPSNIKLKVLKASKVNREEGGATSTGHSMGTSEGSPNSQCCWRELCPGWLGGWTPCTLLKGVSGREWWALSLTEPSQHALRPSLCDSSARPGGRTGRRYPVPMPWRLP